MLFVSLHCFIYTSGESLVISYGGWVFILLFFNEGFVLRIVSLWICGVLANCAGVLGLWLATIYGWNKSSEWHPSFAWYSTSDFSQLAEILKLFSVNTIPALLCAKLNQLIYGAWVLHWPRHTHHTEHQPTLWCVPLRDVFPAQGKLWLSVLRLHRCTGTQLETMSLSSPWPMPGSLTITMCMGFMSFPAFPDSGQSSAAAPPQQMGDWSFGGERVGK